MGTLEKGDLPKLTPEKEKILAKIKEIIAGTKEGVNYILDNVIHLDPEILAHLSEEEQAHLDHMVATFEGALGDLCTTPESALMGAIKRLDASQNNKGYLESVRAIMDEMKGMYLLLCHVPGGKDSFEGVNPELLEWLNGRKLDEKSLEEYRKEFMDNGPTLLVTDGVHRHEALKRMHEGDREAFFYLRVSKIGVREAIVKVTGTKLDEEHILIKWEDITEKVCHQMASNLQLALGSPEKDTERLYIRLDTQQFKNNENGKMTWKDIHECKDFPYGGEITSAISTATPDPDLDQYFKLLYEEEKLAKEAKEAKKLTEKLAKEAMEAKKLTEKLAKEAKEDEELAEKAKEAKKLAEKLAKEAKEAKDTVDAMEDEELAKKRVKYTEVQEDGLTAKIYETMMIKIGGRLTPVAIVDLFENKEADHVDSLVNGLFEK